MLDATNEYRSNHNESALALNNLLSNMAQGWANYLQENCLLEHRPFPWPSVAKAENLATRCESPPSGRDPVFDNWANSPGHRENMLGSGYTVMGVGLGLTVGCSEHCWSTLDNHEGAVIVAMYG